MESVPQFLDGLGGHLRLVQYGLEVHPTVIRPRCSATHWANAGGLYPLTTACLHAAAISRIRLVLGVVFCFQGQVAQRIAAMGVESGTDHYELRGRLGRQRLQSGCKDLQVFVAATCLPRSADSRSSPNVRLRLADSRCPYPGNGQRWMERNPTRGFLPEDRGGCCCHGERRS